MRNYLMVRLAALAHHLYARRTTLSERTKVSESKGLRINEGHSTCGNPALREKKAQTAVEYMLLLAVVVSVVLIGFNTYLPHFQESSNIYFNQVSVGILGAPNRCGDEECGTFEDCQNCPYDCCPQFL